METQIIIFLGLLCWAVTHITLVTLLRKPKEIKSKTVFIDETGTLWVYHSPKIFTLYQATQETHETGTNPPEKKKKLL